MNNPAGSDPDIARGGAICSFGSLSVYHSRFENNHCSSLDIARGGSVAAFGQTEIARSVFVGGQISQGVDLLGKEIFGVTGASVLHRGRESTSASGHR